MNEVEMKSYPVNEIFYSLQGEGFHCGRPAVFVRFSGCNLKCPFCDTRHESSILMPLEEILLEIAKYPAGAIVVLTGGEPSLHIDNKLIEALHASGRYVTIETNGTHKLPEGIDWITLSPKGGMTPGGELLKLNYADEIKVINVGQDLQQYFSMSQCTPETKMYLQPCYSDNLEERQRNLSETLTKIKEDPRWTLSSQLHRFLNIP